MAAFWATLRNILTTFYSNIWSHCVTPIVQLDQIWLFLKNLGKILSRNVSQLFGNFSDYFKMSLFKSNYCGYFFGHLLEQKGYF